MVQNWMTGISRQFGRDRSQLNRRAHLFGISFICLGAVGPAAVSAQSATECTASQAQQMINACAVQEYAAADKALNAAWSSAKSFADAVGQGDALLEAQRVWLAYRDAACEVHAKPYEGAPCTRLSKQLA